MSSTWTARSFSRRTASRRCATPTVASIATTRSGGRVRERRGGQDLVRPAPRPDDPVPDPDVGDVLLLRHAYAAGLLHDQGAAVRAGEGVLHLRRLHRDGLFHADP